MLLFSYIINRATNPAANTTTPEVTPSNLVATDFVELAVELEDVLVPVGEPVFVGVVADPPTLFPLTLS